MPRKDYYVDIHSRQKGRGFEQARSDLKRLDGLALKLGASFGAVLAGGRLAKAVGDVVQEASRLAKDADKVGLLTDEFQRLQFGFGLAGVEAGLFTKSMEVFNQRVGEAKTGTGNFGKILEANDVSLRNADRSFKSVNQLLREYANLVQNAASSQDRMYLAREAFGRGGGDFVLALRNGADGVRDLSTEVDKAGGVIDENLLRKAEELDDRWSRFARTLEVNVKGAILAVADALTSAEGGVRKSSLLNATVAQFEREALFLQSQLRFAEFGQESARVDALRAQLDQLEPRLAALRGALEAGPASGPPRRFRNRPGAPTELPAPPDRTPRSGRDPQDAIRKLIESKEHELRLVGLTREQIEAENTLRRAGVHATEDQRDALQGLIAAKHERLAQQDDLLRAERQLIEAQQFFADAAFDGLSSLIVHGEDAEDVVRRLALALADAALQATWLGQGPLAGLFGSRGVAPRRGVGGLFGTIFGGLFGGFFADGGRLGAGRWGIAGERGPEIIHGPAQVTPMRDGAPNRLHITVGVDVDGAGNLLPFVRDVAQQGDAQVLQITGDMVRRSDINFRNRHQTMQWRRT